MIQYLHQSRNDVVTLKANDSKVLRLHVNAAFVVHPDFKSHTSAILTMGCGDIVSYIRKRELNTRSSTEAEL